jgi:GH15 family glucan-1,4-alpha-glucosidase
MVMAMPYNDIGSYGIIGDLHSVALVGMDGSIDWCCLPNFDSPSVFGVILDDQKGGFFRVCPQADTRKRQMYFPETNVLLTRFLHEDGVGEITDFMPISRHADGQFRHEIVRQVGCVRGEMRFRLECRPAFNYARAPQGNDPIVAGSFRRTATSSGTDRNTDAKTKQQWRRSRFRVAGGRTRDVYSGATGRRTFEGR